MSLLFLKLPPDTLPFDLLFTRFFEEVDLLLRDLGSFVLDLTLDASPLADDLDPLCEALLALGEVGVVEVVDGWVSSGWTDKGLSGELSVSGLVSFCIRLINTTG